MNTKELKLTDLSPREMRETEGGIALVLALGAFAIGVAIGGYIAGKIMDKKASKNASSGDSIGG